MGFRIQHGTTSEGPTSSSSPVFYDIGNGTFNGGTSDALSGFLVESVSVSRKSQEGLGAHSVWSVFHPKGRTPREAGNNELANKLTGPAHF